MPYLDYARLYDRYNVDEALRHFLLGVCEKDAQRRAYCSFPEFFSEKPNLIPVDRADLAVRYSFVQTDPDEGWDEHDMDNILGWFNIKMVRLEKREDQVPTRGTLLLPPDFEIERDEDYNGLTSDDPWYVEVMTAEGMTEFLVIDVLVMCEEEGITYLTAIPAGMVMEE